MLPGVVGFEVKTNLQDYVQQNTNTTVNIYRSDNTSTCTSEVFNSNGDIIYSNSTLNFTIPPISTKGNYNSLTECTNGTNQIIYSKDFKVTKSALAPAEDLFTAAIYFIFISLAALLMVNIFTTIARLVLLEQTLYDVLTSWGLFIGMMFMNYLGGEYLVRTFVEDLSNFFLNVTTWTNAVMPLLVWIITMIFVSLKKKKVVNNYETQKGGFRL